MRIPTWPFKSAHRKLLLVTLSLSVTAVLGVALQKEALPASSVGHPHNYFVYVGTYTGASSKGIYGFNFDEKTGRLVPSGTAAEVANPSFVVTDPAHRHLYAVTEM